MKIGIVTTWYERGAAYVSRQYMDFFISQGFEVLIYARGGESYSNGRTNEKWNLNNVTWDNCKSFPITNWNNDKQFSKWLDENSPDIVLFNEQIWLNPILECKKRKIRTCSYIDYYTEELIPLFDIYDAVICNTKKHLTAFKNHRNAIYWPWGTEIDEFSSNINKREKSNIIRFFHSCGVSPSRKGTDLLLRAYDKVSSDKSKLIIHTQIDLHDWYKNDDRVLSIIKKLEKSKKLEVIFKTVTSPGLFYLGDVYVYPSRLDGLGLTVVEALVSGMPVIVPNDGPMNEFVFDSLKSSVIDIEKLYCRADGYYWPQNEIKISSLSKLFDDYSKIDFSDNEISQKASEIFDWKKNSLNVINEFNNIEYHSSNIVDSYKRYLNKEFPLITHIPLLYSIAYRVAKKCLG